MDKEYTCMLCGETFIGAWTDEEAQEEARQNFGEDVFEREPVYVVCDDCYKIIGLD